MCKMLCFYHDVNDFGCYPLDYTTLLALASSRGSELHMLNPARIIDRWGEMGRNRFPTSRPDKNKKA
jgi:hypothetical protein